MDLLHLRICSISRVDPSHEDHCRYSRMTDELEESIGKLLLERLPGMMTGKKCRLLAPTYLEHGRTLLDDRDLAVRLAEHCASTTRPDDSRPVA